MNPLLHISGLHKGFDGITILNGAELSLPEASITLLTGDNGTGKTTLFNIITGVERADAGTVRYNGVEIVNAQPLAIAQLGVSRLFQTPRLFKNLLVWENLLCAAREHAGNTLWNTVLRPSLCARQDAELREKAMGFVQQYGLAGMATEPVHTLSYGQQKLIALCMLEMNGSRLVLLDEPFAGLAPDMIQRVKEMVRHLRSKGKTFLIIEHDLERAADLADHQLRLAEGTIQETLAHG